MTQYNSAHSPRNYGQKTHWQTGWQTGHQQSTRPNPDPNLESSRSSLPGCYAILGLNQGASLADIKTAYRKLARQYHPDLNPGVQDAEDRFKEIQSAYTTLCGQTAEPSLQSPAKPTAEPTHEPTHEPTVRSPQSTTHRPAPKHSEVYQMFMNGIGSSQL
ncbi:MAG: J domain-containing protein [Oculatellaceae cyanobacterium Prado106]|jgi:hypothetical protein|nr:J domain-containing protein [Oculatellaceae cyanobacterium Prado106]